MSPTAGLLEWREADLTHSMCNIEVHCYFCSWSGEIDNKLDFTCPTCGIEFGVLDNDGIQRANQVITEFIDKYQTGRTDFPVAEEIGFACCKLQTLSGKVVTSQTKKLFKQLWGKKTIQYSIVLPLIIEFHAQINKSFYDMQFQTKIEQERVPLRDYELPF